MPTHEPTLSDAEFHRFRELIYGLTGIALSDAKRALVQSRLQKRLRHHGLTSFGDYYALVTAQGAGGDETGIVINCITTNKTDFYREPHHFTFIQENVIPDLIAQVRRRERPPALRVWHAGCSTGEEPYTLAITLAEALAGQGDWDVRQLASDIDTNVLAHAERAIYGADRIAPVPPALLKRYFLRGKDARRDEFKVKAVLRDQIAFRQINLLAEDWPIRADVRFDVIFCRNVVIYFDKPTQRRLFARFAERLRPGGHLIIGHSESLLGISDAFLPVGHTIYQFPGGEPGTRPIRQGEAA